MFNSFKSSSFAFNKTRIRNAIIPLNNNYINCNLNKSLLTNHKINNYSSTYQLTQTRQNKSSSSSRKSLSFSKEPNKLIYAKNKLLRSQPKLYFNLNPTTHLLNHHSFNLDVIRRNFSKMSEELATNLINSNNGDVEKSTTCEKNSKFELAPKYQGLENNVWVEFIDLNAKLNTLNLGQGFPDFMPAEKVVKELAKTCDLDANPLLHQYTRAYGHPRLVKALAALYGRLINRTINPMTEVLVSGGAYGALFCAIMSNVSPGDEVIIIEPFFDCYEPLVKLAGGTPVFIPLRPIDSSDETSGGWALDEIELRNLFNSKTKAIILNTPNNPLGKVFTLSELQMIGDLCKEFNVLVISDEVYEWLVYEGYEHVRIAALDGMWDRTITIGSAGKTFSLTGWKLGWSYGPAHLIKNLHIAHQNCGYTCQTPGQEALGAALEKELKRLNTPASFFIKMASDLKERRDVMSRSIKESGMTAVIPQGGYFMLANWRPLESKTDLSGETDACADYRFVKWLAKTWKLLGIPPSAFYSSKNKELAGDYIRLCFYKKTETLQKADEILKQLKNS